MKKIFRGIITTILIIVVIISLFIAPVNASTSFYDTASDLLIKSNFEADASFSGYATAQGSCTDGKYAYFAIKNGYTTILKYNMKNFELVDKIRDIDLDHANDMTYNSKAKKIIVANNEPNYDIISILDPKTLKIITYKRIPLKIYSISYIPKKNQYVVGISGTYNFAILDSKFNVVKKYKGQKTGYTRQGCDCDDKYIYFAQSGHGHNIIVIYDYNGKYVDTISINSGREIENIFHVNNNFYVSLFYYGNFLYRVGLSKDKDITYTVSYDANGGSGKMKNTIVKYGNDTKLRDCTFTRNNYHFAGWIAQRECDDKILGYSFYDSKEEYLDEKDIYKYSLYPNEASVARTTKLGNVTLKAFWISDKYVICYNQGESESGSINDYFPTYDEELKTQENVFYKNGFVFTGYIAHRNFDDRSYGYMKNSNKAMWLPDNLIDSYYIFKENEKISKLTYAGTVTFTPQFKSAFEYDKTKSTITNYYGNDSTVYIPENPETYAIGKESFNSSNIYNMVFHNNINQIPESSIVDCNSLEGIYFRDYFPNNISNEFIKGSSTPAIYLSTKNEDIFLGWYTDKTSVSIIKTVAQTILSK